MMVNQKMERARLRATGTVRLPGFVLNLGVHSPGSLLPQHMQRGSDNLLRAAWRIH